MRRTCVIVGLLILSVVCPAVLRGTPARADTLPVVASGGGPAHGWTAIEWTHTSGAQGQLTILNSNVSGPGFASLYIYDASDHTLAGGNVGITGNLGDAHVQVNVPPAPSVDKTVVTSRSIPYGGEVNINFDSTSLPPGTYKAVFVAGGDGTGWTWALKGNAEVSPPTATTSGSDVYAYSAKDFSGLASTQTYAGFGAVASMGGEANAETQRSSTAAHTLVGIGFFAPATGAAVQMGMQGPTGSQSCICTLSDFRGPGAAGPGTWTFTYTGAGAGTSNLADVLVGAADAFLPEP
ncbi:MAG: hypothetical protein JOZ04_03610 [Acidimicrobiia bacterium]|nr:hypothetical protein [Acidimicrobiia bacterium]